MVPTTKPRRRRRRQFPTPRQRITPAFLRSVDVHYSYIIVELPDIGASVKQPLQRSFRQFTDQHGTGGDVRHVGVVKNTSIPRVQHSLTLSAAAHDCVTFLILGRPLKLPTIQLALENL